MTCATRSEFTAAEEATGPAPVLLWQQLRGERPDPLERWTRIAREHGAVARYRSGLGQTWFISTAEGARRVLQENAANYPKQHASYSLLRLLFGNGLFTSNGDFWLRQRRLAQPAFHRERIGAMGARMVEAAAETARAWEARAASALPFTRAVIEESMRLRPPLYILIRGALADDVVCGKRIHRGGVVVLSPLVLHRSPLYWDRPDDFVPERWLDAEAERKRPRFAWLPFGGGPRQCIGNSFAMMEAVLILATLAQRFSPRLAEGYTLRPEYLVLARPAQGAPMVLRKRDALQS